MLRPVPGGVTLLYPFTLHSFLKRSHHEVGFLHEIVDEMGPSTWFHGYAPYWLTPRVRSNCSSSSNTLRSSVSPVCAFSHKACSYCKPCSSSVRGAPCEDSCVCSARSFACKACCRDCVFWSVSAMRVSINSTRWCNSIGRLLVKDSAIT